MSHHSLAPSQLSGWRYGFYGKLPSHGDFVQAGLPRLFVREYDNWIARVLPASQKRLGPAWLPAWLEAPIWRFILPAGVWGEQAAFGLWMPSVDHVGRYFPFVLAACVETNVAPACATVGAFLGAAEGTGLAALNGTLPAAAIVRQLSRLSGPVLELPARPDGTAVWWTAGAPRVKACQRQMRGLPDDGTFVSMLDDGPDS